MKKSFYFKTLMAVAFMIGILSTFPVSLLAADNKTTDEPQTSIIEFAPQWNESGTNFRHTWEGVSNVDQAFWLQHGNMQAQLEIMRKDLNIKSVRAVSALDDIMRTYAEDPKGWREKERNPRANFRMIDEAFDALLKVGLNPMVTTCFMQNKWHQARRKYFVTEVLPPQKIIKNGEISFPILPNILLIDMVPKWFQNGILKFGTNPILAISGKMRTKPNSSNYGRFLIGQSKM